MSSAAVLLIAVVMATWASLYAFVSCQKSLNEMRDIMLLGKAGTEKVSISFRKHMLSNDWVPAWIATAFVCFSFGLVDLLGPLLLPAESRSFLMWLLCIVLSAFPLLTSLAWLSCGYEDYKLIRAELERAEKGEPRDARAH